MAEVLEVGKSAVTNAANRLHESPDSGWVERKRLPRSDRVSDQILGIIDGWLHGSQASTEDNARTKPILIPTSVLDANGDRVFLRHQRRQRKGNTTFLWGLFKKSDEWEQVKHLRADVSTHDFVGGPWLIQRAMCPCLKPASVSFCSCHFCCELFVNLETYRQTRPHIRNQTTCDCPGKKCETGPWSTFLKDVTTMEGALMCPPRHIPALDMPEMDTKNCIEVEKTKEFFMRDAACHACHEDINVGQTDRLEAECALAKRIADQDPSDVRAQEHFASLQAAVQEQCVPSAAVPRASDACSKCGWDVVFKDLPLQTVTYVEGKVGSRAEVTRSFRGCARECTDDKFTWQRFEHVHCGYDDKGVARFRKEWVPVTASRAEFMVFLKTAFEKFQAHIFNVRWEKIYERRFERLCCHGPAIHGEPSNMLDVMSDFSSAVEHTKRETGTCCFPESSSCLVAIAGMNERKIEISVAGKKNMRGTDFADRPNFKFVRDNECFYFFSKWKPDSTYQAECLQMLYQICTTGCLDDTYVGSGVEVFRDQQRLLGSDTSSPLPDGLADATVAEPLCDSMPTCCRHRRDGCAVQYQCKHSYLRASQFVRRANTVRGSQLAGFCDCRHAAYHGKCSCDSAGKIPKNLITGGAESSALVAPGTQALARFLAERLDAVRPDPESNKYKRNTLTGYTVVYVPESFLRARRLMAREGYANSSKDHQFCADETGTTLQSRRKWCPCTPCLTSPTLCADVPYAAKSPSKYLLQHIVGEATTRHPQQQAAAVNVSARK